MLAQVQQTAACNALHDVQTRMCRWLLRMHDLGGVDLPLTQEFLAQMLGVRRTSVTDGCRRNAEGGHDFLWSRPAAYHRSSAGPDESL
jgi:Crp-like helix-turn-helix domain